MYTSKNEPEGNWALGRQHRLIRSNKCPTLMGGVVKGERQGGEGFMGSLCASCCEPKTT